LVELMGIGAASVQSDHTSTQSSGGGIVRPSRKRFGRHRRASGFTLLETMIAMSILAIGTLGVAGSLITSMKMTRESLSRTQAIYLAEQQMEIFHLMTTAEITVAMANPPSGDTALIDPDPNDADPTTFTRTWEILADDPQPDVFTVTVIVGFFDTLGNPRTERLQALKAGL
jgi:prepilin-type N-terminal cleavage/methylation domain-containing protein